MSDISKLNPNMKIYDVTAKEFAVYGRIVSGYDFTDTIKWLKEKSEMPEDGVIYVASDEDMEDTPLKSQIQNAFYGAMPVQFGYCNGHGDSLNGLEYHKGVEVIVAATPIALMVGKVNDICCNKYDSDGIETFIVPEGMAVCLYGTTLHFAPCKLSDDGFLAGIILPRGTNSEIVKVDPPTDDESKLLFMNNKWLLMHKDVLDGKTMAGEIVGENWTIKY